MADKNLIDLTQKTPVGTDRLPVWPQTVSSSNDLKYATVDAIDTYTNRKIVYKGDLLFGTAASTVGALSIGSVPNGIPLVTYSSTTTGASWGQLTAGGISTGAVTKAKVASESRTAYVPTLLIGSASVPITNTYSRFTQIGKEVFGTVNVQATSTTSSGTNTFRINITGSGLPLPTGIGTAANNYCNNTDLHCGSGSYTSLSGGALNVDNESATQFQVVITKDPAGTSTFGTDFFFVFETSGTTANPGRNALKGSMAIYETLKFSFQYEAA